jgi:ubiquinone/menaquinone biosynthesis C-methylase UbiE
VSKQDQWSKWLLETRFGGDVAQAARAMQRLQGVRDEVLRNASLRTGETLLDVGCGDGLVGFAALERVGPGGHVIFSDISRPMLDHCERLATEGGLRDRCSFVEAGAEDLSAVADASVDVVTTRSVLIYVRDKAAALREFHRVLRPGGRLSLFEPINRFGETYELNRDWWTGEGSAVADLGERLRDYFRALQPLDSDPMMDFDQHDLVRLTEREGFPNVHLAYHVFVMTSPPASWDAVVKAPGNPNIPSLAEAMDRIFNAEERARFEAHVRPHVEAGGRTTRMAVAYLTARKGAVAESNDG